MAASRARAFSHAVVLSDDVRFHEHIERVLRAISPTCLVSRAHPDGDLGVLRALMPQSAAPSTCLILDHRQGKRPELWKLIRKHMADGGRAILVSETPIHAKDMLEGQELELDVFLHHAQWNHELIADALAAILTSESFEPVVFAPPGESAAHGEALISSARQKSEFLAAMNDALAEAGVQRTRRSKISSAADELLMNAIYDAPSLSEGSRLYKNVGKRSDVELDPGMKVHTRWQLARDAFHFEVADPYGTFALDALCKRLAKFFAERTMEINQTTVAGSGVGIYAILRHCSRYLAHVIPGKRTAISVKIDLAPTRASRIKRHKEIFVFFHR